MLNRLSAVSSSLGVGGSMTIQQLKAAADAARARGDRAADVYYRRQVCRKDPQKLGAWIQYGHALKEAGFHDRSGKAYRQALTLQPESAEINLQLGHLSKVAGDLDAAARFFETAVALGYEGGDDPGFQLRLLRRVDNKTIYREVSPDQEKSGVRFYLSSPSRSIREDSKSEASQGLGQADYSYAFAMKGFIEALEALEMDFAVISNPEFISDIRERSDAAINIHLGFYPPERLRLLKGAYNIDCFAWEFDRLRSPAELTTYHAFADQATMLDRVDEVWTPSSHGAEAVRQSTRRPVHFVPSPVISGLAKRPRPGLIGPREVEKAARGLVEVRWEPLSILPRIQETMDYAARSRRASLPAIIGMRALEEPPKIFLSVFNVHDFRKQIEPLISGFQRFAEQDESAILLLKVTTPHRDNESAHSHVMKDQIHNAARLIPPIVSDRIWLTHDVLTREELVRLYDLASFYVCTSYAEGQNLPLIEAMGRGAVPVSVMHTAMSDYITEDNAVVLETQRRPLGTRLSNRYGMFGLETNFVTDTEVASGLARAARMDDADYAARSAAALRTVEDRFGLAGFQSRVDTLIQMLQTQQVPA